MDKLEKYRAAIQTILHKYGDDYGKPEDGVETQMTIDRERDHYHLFHTGWHNGRHIYGCFLHLDIKPLMLTNFTIRPAARRRVMKRAVCTASKLSPHNTKT